jgi:hypothetical protein
MSKEIRDLTSRIRPLSDQPGVGSVLQLLNLYINEWKEDLINAEGDNSLKIKGAIIKVRGIIDDIKRDRQQMDYRNGAYNGEGT